LPILQEKTIDGNLLNVFSTKITEEELLAMESISPEDVLRLNKITENYLCPTEANVFGIDFTRFVFRRRFM